MVAVQSLLPPATAPKNARSPEAAVPALTKSSAAAE